MSKILKIFLEKKKILLSIALGLVLIFLPLKAVISSMITAHDQNVFTYKNTSKDILLEASHHDIADPLFTFYIITSPSSGELDVSAGMPITPPAYVTYTPKADYVGQDSFTFRAVDQDGQLSNTATVSIEISEPPDITGQWCPDCKPWNPLACLFCIAQYILSLPIRIGFFILILPLALLALCSSILFSVMTEVTNWMMDVALSVGITPTNSATPDIVNIGWTFTRDFINMFFILILVFIGLATILKLKEYEAKKTLPKLILVALLINFTPVIVGFIVDMGNIVTSFFVKRAKEIFDVETLIKMGWDYFTTTLITIFTADGTFFTNFGAILGELVGLVAYGIVMVGFFLLGSWIYFWVMLVFFMRIIMLWILMILAPIAFFSQVLPPRSKTVGMVFPSILHWDKWWEELLQWVIVGIPLGFFLYLSNWIMLNTSKIVNKDVFPVEQLKEQFVVRPGLTVKFIELIASIFVPLVALAILHRGYKIAKETAPAAAVGIIDGVKKAATFATAVGLTAATAGAAAGAGASALGKGATGAARMEAFLGERTLTKPLQYLVGKPAKWATRGLEMVAAPSLLEYATKSREIKIPKEFGSWTPEEQQQFTRARALTKEAKVKYTNEMIKSGTFEKTDSSFQKEMFAAAESLVKNPHYKKEVDAIMKALPDKVTKDIMIDFQVGKEKRDEMKEDIEELMNKLGIDKDKAATRILVSKMSPEEVSKIATKDLHLNEDIMQGAMHLEGSQLRKAAEKFGPKFINKYNEKAEEKGMQWFLENNPSGLLYRSGNAAQDFGYTTPEGWDRKKTMEAIIRVRRRGLAEQKLNAIIEKEPAIRDYIGAGEEKKKAQKEIEETEKQIEEIKATIVAELERGETREDAVKRERGEAIKEARQQRDNLKKIIEGAKKQQKNTEKQIKITPKLKKTWEEIQKLQNEIKELKQSPQEKKPTEKDTEREVRRKIRERPPAGIV